MQFHTHFFKDAAEIDKINIRQATLLYAPIYPEFASETITFAS